MTTKFVKVTGLEKTLENIRRVPQVLSMGRDSPIRGALFDAGQVIKKAAIANAPTGHGTPFPGLLKKSIYLARVRKAGVSPGIERYVIAVRSTRRKGRGRFFGARTAGAYYWHFVEFGTKGPGRGQRAQKYLTRAYMDNAEASLNRFSQALAKRFDNALKKLRR